ncbi:hypothetical protein pipiens_015840 [Culex pipiens pipiens]|uniref:Uncharacterized protein n=1 Tax=Culex pipiens pipiens TaxID=38569 RepID=A0ABD1CQH0_CULPP
MQRGRLLECRIGLFGRTSLVHPCTPGQKIGAEHPQDQPGGLIEEITCQVGSGPGNSIRLLNELIARGSNAEKVKRKNCILKIRFAPNATALRVSNLGPFGTNELLYRVFDQGLRFADVGSLDHEYGQRWKHMHEVYKQKVEALKRDMVMEEEKLEAQMEFARHEHEIEQLREQLRMREQDKARKKADWEMKEHFVIESRERLQQQMSDQRMGFQGNNNFNNRNKFFDMMNQGGGGGGGNRNNSFGWEVRNYGHGGRNEMDQQQDQQQQQQQQQFQEGLPDQDRDRNRVLEVHAVKVAW